jgi:type I restriction enzyme S subunit
MLGSRVLDQIGLAKTRAAQPHLNAEDLGDVEVTVSTRDQEVAIADYLDRETAQIDALLEARRKQAKLLVDHRRAVIDGFTVPGALGGQADAETAWPIAKLKRAAAFFADGDWIESPFITTDGIRLIQTGNIGEGIYRDQGFRYISDETFRTLACTEVVPGDILISRLAGTVGQSCLAPDLGTRMVVSVDVVIMRPFPDLEPAFAVTYLSSSYHLALAELLARGTTMPRLSRSQVGELPIPMPPFDVQRRVVGEIERRLAGVNALGVAVDLQVARLLERRQALITAAVTGQLDIPGVAA